MVDWCVEIRKAREANAEAPPRATNGSDHAARATVGSGEAPRATTGNDQAARATKGSGEAPCATVDRDLATGRWTEMVVLRNPV